jgi:hypothetical protein
VEFNWEGLLVHGGDAGVPGRGEGAGALAAGEKGISWVIVGALGGLFSRRTGMIGWNDLRYFTVQRDPPSVSFGYQQKGVKGAVTYQPLGETAYSGPGSSRKRLERLALEYLPRDGWRYDNLEEGTEAWWSADKARDSAIARR